MPTPHQLLLIYFLIYFLFAFVWRSVLVYRRTGVNPLVLPKSDDAYGYVGVAFKITILACAAVVFCLALAPEAAPWLGPYLPLESVAIACAGWALLIASLMWMLVAQAQMGASWRIGIDTKRHTGLVQNGLFAVSRNPIFLATRLNLLGLFLVYPSAATIAICVAGEILVQVQVRLEELHLQTLHGPVYLAYQNKVRRWL